VSADLGTQALEEGDSVDFARLRAERRARCLASMEQQGIDLLLLGRDSNARYVSGQRRLWYAGTRPFSPGCVVVRSTGEVHLSAIHADGVPAEISHDQLFAFSWNPATFAQSLREIDGVSDARRVAVDGMSPSFASLLPQLLPDAQWSDGEQFMRELRSAKTPDEIACTRLAIAISESAFQQVAAAIRPGASERELAGRFVEALATRGTTIPSMQGMFCATPLTGTKNGTPPLRQISTDRALRAGELVAIDAGALYAGYEGGVGRTWPCGDTHTRAQRELLKRWRGVMDALVDACRVGEPASVLRQAHLASREPLPPCSILQGLGLGVEPPFAGAPIDPVLESQWELRSQSVLSLQSYVWEEGVGGYFGREIVLLTDAGPQRLSTLDGGPLE
jgi:Xaa-Pro dipeptidase